MMMNLFNETQLWNPEVRPAPEGHSTNVKKKKSSIQASWQTKPLKILVYLKRKHHNEHSLWLRGRVL